MYNLDISLLRTFLELNKTRHFGKTAENLYLTQSAVSARIKQLEDLLGVPLFERHRNNIQLTPQGERLIQHAELLLNNWTRAVQDVSLPDSVSQLVIGAPQSVWEAQLSLVPIDLLAAFDTLHVRAESLSSPIILRRVQERTLDLGFTFEPCKVEDIVCQKIFEIELKLYSSKTDYDFSSVSENDYVLVDWGQSFSALHARTLPQIRSPRLHASTWTMAVDCLIKSGGAAFLPTSLVQSHGYPLQLVNDAPSMSREVFTCYHSSREERADWKDICQLIERYRKL